MPTHIGRYRVLGELGRGAMGVVYRGLDETLDREVALKVLSAAHTHDHDARGRFLREGRAVGRLQHPNIVTVFELGEHEGAPFMAMELLDGRDLQQAIREGLRPDPRVTLPIVLQVLAGLGHAHEHGIVHRDIKPSNIFLPRGLSAKITDFGIARLASNLGTAMTSTGTMVGTPNYMSPEQVKAVKVDARSDLFSAGLILFELVTGEKAYQADSVVSILFKIVQGPPDLGLIPRAPEWSRLREVLARALEGAPDDRYPDADTMARELAVALGDLGGAAPDLSSTADRAILTRSRRAGASPRGGEAAEDSGADDPRAAKTAAWSGPTELGDASALELPAPVAPPRVPTPKVLPARVAPAERVVPPARAVPPAREVLPPAGPRPPIGLIAGALGVAALVVVAGVLAWRALAPRPPVAATAASLVQSSNTSVPARPSATPIGPGAPSPGNAPATLAPAMTAPAMTAPATTAPATATSPLPGPVPSLGPPATVAALAPAMAVPIPSRLSAGAPPSSGTVATPAPPAAREPSGSAEERLARADALFEQGRFARALAEARAVLQRDPANAEARTLVEDSEAALAVETALKNARDAMKRGDREAALVQVRNGLAVSATDSRLIALFRELQR